MKKILCVLCLLAILAQAALPIGCLADETSLLLVI